MILQRNCVDANELQRKDDADKALYRNIYHEIRQDKALKALPVHNSSRKTILSSS